MRLLNALNSDDRGLKVRASLGMVVFETIELILSQMISSQGKERTFRPLSSLFSAFSSLKERVAASQIDRIVSGRLRVVEELFFFFKGTPWKFWLLKCRWRDILDLFLCQYCEVSNINKNASLGGGGETGVCVYCFHNLRVHNNAVQYADGARVGKLLKDWAFAWSDPILACFSIWIMDLEFKFSHWLRNVDGWSNVAVWPRRPSSLVSSVITSRRFLQDTVQLWY